MGRVIGDVMVFEFCATSVIESKTHRLSAGISEILILSECLCVIRVTESSARTEKSFISGGVVSTAATRCTTARCAIILDLSTIDQPQQQQHRVFQFTIDGLLVHPI